MTNKMDVYLSAALANGDEKTKISFSFRASEKFNAKAAEMAGIELGSKPNRKIAGVYTACGTPDSIKALSCDDSVLTLSGVQNLRPLGPA